MGKKPDVVTSILISPRREIVLDKHEWKRNLVDKLERVIPGSYLEITLEAQ